ncbi:MAG: gamma-glutamyltransferase [Gammaproteobacteria bacterium]|nr:gamma-glutamyltransferase [Gammaproteobacteria bacterium]
MVASAHPAAAAIGVNILSRGGNAFDAAIAVAAAEGVLLPMMCGLGGDAFVVLHNAARGETLAYNGSGVAAAGATQEYFANAGFRTMPLDGVHSVAVPGAVGVYEAIHRRHCTLPWADLWAPAIALAQDGVAITEYVSHRIAEQRHLLERYPYSARQFLPGGGVPQPGDRWMAPDLARSLRAVAEGGAEVLYRGELAQRLLAFLRSEGAMFEADDFAQQQPTIYEPLTTQYRDLQVSVTAPPSQGFLLSTQLNIIEGFDPQALGALSGERIHLLVEAKKLAFADRNRYAGDPDYVDWPLETLISQAHAQRRRAEIDPEQARWPDGALVAEHSGDTSYFAVADGDGNAVSFIHSLSAAFGSAVVAGDTGITLNNRAGRGFSLDPAHPNVIAPGRRTMHTLNAYIVFRDGHPWLIGGTPGGDQQTQWSTQVVTGVVDYGLTVQEAVDAPRWYSFPGTDPANLGLDPSVRVEQGVGELACKRLRALGHQVQTVPAWGGGGAVQLIMLDRERGVLRGGSDSRPGGIALGF